MIVDGRRLGMASRALRVATIDTYAGFWEDSLVARLLRSRHGAEHTDNPVDADLVLRGPFAGPQSPSTAAFEADQGDLNSYRRQLRQQLGRTGQVWLQVSGESPSYSPIASFSSSLCDFGIGHEWLPQQPRYCHLPHWMETLDWSARDVPPAPRQQARLGRGIDPHDLLQPIAARFPYALERPWQACLISSHWLGNRLWLYDEVRRVLPVQVYGRAASHAIRGHDHSDFEKQTVLQSHLFALCPENDLHPGYCTEKVVDAFACGAIPLGWFLPAPGGHPWRFNPEAVINLLDLSSRGIGRGLLLDVLSKPQRLERLLHSPLLLQPPSLDPLEAFLASVVEAARQ